MNFLYEVVIKRIAALDDIRKGLGEVKVSGVSFLSLLERFPELQERVFPLINARMLRSYMKYDQESCNDPLRLEAQRFFEQYIDELEESNFTFDSCMLTTSYKVNCLLVLSF